MSKTVLIVDSDLDRGRANCDAFAGCSSATYFFDGSKCAQAGNYLVDVGIPAGTLDLVLLHNNDTKIWTESHLLANCILRYTGGSPREGEANWIVARPLIGKAEAVTSREASEIMKWVDLGCPNEESGLPSLLRRNQDKVLPALAILCQGYLAVHAKQPDMVKAWGIGGALAKMGWDEKKHPDLVRDKIQDVEKPGWWLDVFELRVRQTVSGEEKEKWVVDKDRWKAFSDSIAREWGDGNDGFLQNAFIEKTLHANQNVDTPKVVAEAYIEIAERLARNKS